MPDRNRQERGFVNQGVPWFMVLMFAAEPRRTTLKTALTPDEVRARLVAAIDPPLSLFGRRPVRGTVGQYTAGLTRRLTYNNAFQTRLSLVIEPEDERAGRGCILHGAFGISLFAKIVLIFTAVAVLTATLATHANPNAGAVMPWVIAGGGLLAIGMVYGVGRAMGQGDEEALIRFLIQTLTAKVVATPHDH